MAELVHENGTVRWRGEDPEEALAAIEQLGNEAGDCTLHGIDSTELPVLPGGDSEKERIEAVKALPKVKLIREKPSAEVLIVNEATGATEQTLSGSGKIEIADPEDPDRTTEVTPAQLAKLSTERALDHAVSAHEQAIEGHDSEADRAASALAEVYREAVDAEEQISPAEALTRAQARIAEGAGGGEAAPPSEIRHEGEPVKLRVTKA